MTRINLYGPKGSQQLNVQPRDLGHSVPNSDAGRIHRDAVFACLRDMQTLFDTAGISESEYWSTIRSEFSIVSRTELSASMWARLSATLNACRRDPVLFNKLVAKVKAHKAKSVPIEDASPIVFADPEDVKDIVADTPLTPPESTPAPIREHRTQLTPDTLCAVIEQMDRRWLKPSEILSVATTQFRMEAAPKALKKVLHGLFMRGKLEHKQIGPQEWYRHLAVNWRLKNSIVVNMENLQRLNDWNTASRIKDEMYDKYNLLTVESVAEALDTLAEINPQMLIEVIDDTRHYHWKVKSAPAPEKPKAKLNVQDLLAGVDARLEVQS